MVPPIITILIIAIVTIIVFSVLVKKLKPDEYWNWWISFVATIVSLILGAGIGIYLFDYSQDKIRNDDKERLTAALESELSELYSILTTGGRMTIKDKDNKHIEVLMLNLNQIIVDDAIRSNLFDHDITSQLIKISRNINILDSSVDNLWAFLRVGAIYNTEYRMDVVKTSVANIEKFEANIKFSIEKLELLLDKNFTKKKT